MEIPRYSQPLTLFGNQGPQQGKISSPEGALSFHRLVTEGVATKHASVQPVVATGIAQLGLLGFVVQQREQAALEQARTEVMRELDLTEDAVLAMSETERAAFDAQVFEKQEEILAQAVKEHALEEMDEEASRLYKQTPPPPEKDINIPI